MMHSTTQPINQSPIETLFGDLKSKEYPRLRSELVVCGSCDNCTSREGGQCCIMAVMQKSVSADVAAKPPPAGPAKRRVSMGSDDCNLWDPDHFEVRCKPSVQPNPGEEEEDPDGGTAFVESQNREDRFLEKEPDLMETELQNLIQSDVTSTKLSVPSRIHPASSTSVERHRKNSDVEAQATRASSGGESGATNERQEHADLVNGEGEEVPKAQEESLYSRRLRVFSRKSSLIIRKQQLFKTNTMKYRADQDDNDIDFSGACELWEEADDESKHRKKMKNGRGSTNASFSRAFSKSIRWSSVKTKILFQFRLKGGHSPDSRTIAVKNLAATVTDEILRDFFERAGHGAVAGVTITRDKEGMCAGFAYVEFDSAHAARKALQKSGKRLEEKVIFCDITEERPTLRSAHAHARAAAAKCEEAPAASTPFPSQGAVCHESLAAHPTDGPGLKGSASRDHHSSQTAAQSSDSSRGDHPGEVASNVSPMKDVSDESAQFSPRKATIANSEGPVKKSMGYSFSVNFRRRGQSLAVAASGDQGSQEEKKWPWGRLRRKGTPSTRIWWPWNKRSRWHLWHIGSNLSVHWGRGSRRTGSFRSEGPDGPAG